MDLTTIAPFADVTPATSPAEHLAGVLADLNVTVDRMTDEGIAWEHIAPLARLQLEGAALQFDDSPDAAALEVFISHCMGACVALEVQIADANAVRAGIH